VNRRIECFGSVTITLKRDELPNGISLKAAAYVGQRDP
jgi:hypothetical protein